MLQVMNLNATTGHEKRPISTGDLNSDCLQRLITVHTIVFLQLFFTGLLSSPRGFRLAHVLSLFFSTPHYSFCVAVVKIKAQWNKVFAVLACQASRRAMNCVR